MGAGSGEHPLLSTAVLRARANDLVAPCCNFYGNTRSHQDESCICNVTHISKKKKKKKKKMCMRAWAHTQSAWWRFLIRWHSRVGLMLLFEREKLAKKRAQRNATRDALGEGLQSSAPPSRSCSAASWSLPGANKQLEVRRCRFRPKAKEEGSPKGMRTLGRAGLLVLNCPSKGRLVLGSECA